MIEVLRDGSVTRVVLSRADTRNALDLETVRRMRRLLDETTRDPECRVVVLESSVPRVFSVGMDLDGLRGTIDRGAGPADLLDIAGEYVGLLDALLRCKCLTIAAVDGVAVGGGVDLSAACDITLATSQAAFSIALLRRNVFPVTTYGVLAPRIGHHAFMQWLANGQYYSAERAQRISLVSEVVASDALEHRALELAARFSAFAPGQVSLGMSMIRRVLADPVRERAAELSAWLALNLEMFGGARGSPS